MTNDSVVWCWCSRMPYKHQWNKNNSMGSWCPLEPVREPNEEAPIRTETDLSVDTISTPQE